MNPHYRCAAAPVRLMLLFLVLILAAGQAFAEEMYQDLAEVGSGSLLTAEPGGGYKSLTRMTCRYRVQVSGMVARTELEQSFRNDSKAWVEAIYVFPLPSSAAVNAMRIKVGERVIEGEIKERQEARRIYVQAREQGKRAGLVEQQRPNLFTTRVANIGPGETVIVQLDYVQLLDYDQGRFEMRLPMTITPRYIPGQQAGAEEQVLESHGWSFATDQVPDAGDITPPQVHGADLDTGDHLARLEIDLEPGFEVSSFNSPYHDIQTTRSGASYHVTPKAGAVLMDRDFVLSWQPVAEQAPVAAFFQETVGNADHGMLMLLPPVSDSAVVVPPRELILVIDTSGSMAGTSITQAREALSMALNQLRPQDRFNIIEFNSFTHVLFSAPVPAGNEYLNQARRYINTLQANGGTEMAGALNAAFSGTTPEGYVRQIVFITDGSVGNETSLFGLIHTRIGNARLYTVGIGSAPNGYFMREAARFGRGTYTWVGSTDEVKTKISALFSKIEKPAVTQIQVSFGANAEIYPTTVPDLYVGEPLLVNAKLDHWPGQVTVTGQFNGRQWSRTIKLPATPGDNPGVATLWARQKVAWLRDEGIRTGDPAHYKKDITDVGLTYHIITPYTSFVAVDKTPVRPSGDPLKSDAVPNLMPAGSQQLAPGAGYPRTALGLDRDWFFGSLALLFALLILGLERDRLRWCRPLR